MNYRLPENLPDISGTPEYPDVDFFAEVIGKRVSTICQLSPVQNGMPRPLLLDVLGVDMDVRMLKVKTVLPPGMATEDRTWWIALSAITTIAVMPEDSRLVQPVAPSIVV